MLPEQDIDDHPVFIDRAVQIALLSLAEQEDLIHDPMLTD